MIIIGYPGVGKTTSAGKFPATIDLETSTCLGSHSTPSTTTTLTSIATVSNGTIVPKDTVVKEFSTYCKIAEHLSSTNKIVFVSSHKEVQEYFCKSTEVVYACYPSKDVKIEWLQFLRNRYVEDDSDKNYSAYMRAVNHFDEDIDHLSSRGFINIELSDGAFLSDILEKSFYKPEETNYVTEDTEDVDATENFE